MVGGGLERGLGIAVQGQLEGPARGILRGARAEGIALQPACRAVEFELRQGHGLALGRFEFHEAIDLARWNGNFQPAVVRRHLGDLRQFDKGIGRPFVGAGDPRFGEAVRRAWLGQQADLGEQETIDRRAAWLILGGGRGAEGSQHNAGKGGKSEIDNTGWSFLMHFGFSFRLGNSGFTFHVSEQQSFQTLRIIMQPKCVSITP